MSKLCKITFYTDAKAFEIYKCKSLTDEDVDNDYELNDHENHWEFNWGDRLRIDWIGNQSGPKYFLKFENNNNKNSNNQRKSPIAGHHDDASFEIARSEIIVFVKEANDEAEWSFNFYWGVSKDTSCTAANSIDPNAKIKDTPW